MPLVPLYDSYRYSMRWMDGDVSIPSPHTHDIHKPSIALLPYLCLYVTSLRLRISRSSGSICLPLCFHSFYHALLASLLIYKPFQTNDTIQKYDRMLTTWLRSNILIMVNMFTIISLIKMEMVN